MDIPVFSQATRAIQVTTAFGGDTLLFGKMSATESVSHLFELELTLFSEKGDLDPDQILGKPLAVTVATGERLPQRFFHGLVTDFAQGGYNERLHEYRIAWCEPGAAGPHVGGSCYASHRDRRHGR